MSVRVKQKKLFTEAFGCFVSGVALKEIRTVADFDANFSDQMYRYLVNA